MVVIQVRFKQKSHNELLGKRKKCVRIRKVKYVTGDDVIIMIMTYPKTPFFCCS